MKPNKFLLLILGLILIGAGIYLFSIIRKTITGYQEVPVSPSDPSKGYFKQAIYSQTHPYIIISVTILILGALFIALSMIEIIESMRSSRVNSGVKNIYKQNFVNIQAIGDFSIFKRLKSACVKSRRRVYLPAFILHLVYSFNLISCLSGNDALKIA